jgi:acyl-homoserine lactone acylase PvdQ
VEPREGLTIVRDTYGVPHIRGRTRALVAFGSGWAAIEDRGTLLEAARGPGRVAIISPPGINAFGLLTSFRQFRPTAAAEEFVARQAALLERTRKGRAVLRDMDAWADGVNAFYEETNAQSTPWTRVDVMAVLAFIGSIFGTSGGSEVQNADFVAQLQQRLGPADGLAVFRDLKSSQDPEAPATVRRRAPYDPVPTGPTPGSPIVDAGSRNAAAKTADAARAAGRQTMSNALVVGGRRSRTRRPLFVAGPQLGYFYPEIVHEQDLHGGGYDVRGVFAVGPFPIIGRGEDFVWSLTTSNSDNVDQFLEELCNPDGSPPTRDSTSYRYKGECRPMTTFDAGVLVGRGTDPDQPIVFRETVHGPVSGTVTVGGRPYAIAQARTTRGRDSLAALALSDMGRGEARTARQFIRTAHQFEHGFNWHYANDRQIAFFSSGRLPLRARGVDPALPALGTGEYEWRGFLSRRGHPQDVQPRSAMILNWNNKPAPGFGAGDSTFSYGSVHRVELFDGFPRRSRLEDVVGVMNEAATEDLRAHEVWPVIAAVLGGGPAPSPTAQQAADLVTDWVREGGSRLDRDLDGKVDHPGAAVLDAAFPRIADAVLSPVLGDLVDDFAAMRQRDNHPSISNGSSWGGGWYGYVDKDLRRVLGRRVRGPYSRGYCGGGDVNACRASLWTAVQEAANALAAAQGEAPNTWRADAQPERIRFLVGPLSDTMRWTNRPTFQQAIEFSGHRRR